MSEEKHRYNYSDYVQSVSESFFSYISATPAHKHLPIIVESKGSLNRLFSNKILLVSVIRQGIPYSLFELVKKLGPFTEPQWCEYLNLSLKTLQRYKAENEHLFKPIHTEKILEMAEVVLFGQEVFDSNEQFSIWLHTPSFALSNMKPIELLKDSYGKELVMDELNRIDQGIFA